MPTLNLEKTRCLMELANVPRGLESLMDDYVELNKRSDETSEAAMVRLAAEDADYGAAYGRLCQLHDAEAEERAVALHKARKEVDDELMRAARRILRAQGSEPTEAEVKTLAAKLLFAVEDESEADDVDGEEDIGDAGDDGLLVEMDPNDESKLRICKSDVIELCDLRRRYCEAHGIA